MQEDNIVQDIIDFAEKFSGERLPVYQKELVKAILQWEDEKKFKRYREMPDRYADGQKKPHLIIIDDFENRKKHK